MNKEQRKKNFLRWQRQVILSLMAQIEQATNKLFHEFDYALEKELMETMDESYNTATFKPSKLSRLITRLENILQEEFNNGH
jgi:cell shape-determining protein MreC